MNKQVDVSQLKALSPLDSLKKDNLFALAKKTKVREAQPGETLFREGDSEKRTVYVLSGSVELREGDEPGCQDHRRRRRRPQPFIAEAAASPFGGGRDARRVHHDRQRSAGRHADLGSDRLLRSFSELRGETGSNDDWMTTLLQTKAFHKIPPANIQAIFMRLQQVNYKAGDVVIKQGEEGDFFYVITRGRCIVTRETPLNKEGIRLGRARGRGYLRRRSAHLRG